MLPPGAENLGLRLQPVFDLVNDNHRATGYITHDEMKAYLVVTKQQAELKLDEGAVLDALSGNGVIVGVDREAVRQCIARAESRGGVQFMEVATGRTPEYGTDGALEFYVQPSSEEARYSKDASGRINYHELNLIENVAAGQEVARLLEPKPGVPGSTVTGKEIAARGGAPARARSGKGVKLAGAGDVFVADVPGRLVHFDETLSIDQQYEIKGDVDYSVGNVDFVGRVVVHGEVLDDFNVTGRMGIEVRGTVGKCRLTSDGDIVLGSGMNGRTAGRIKTGGAVKARYLNEVTVEADGDVSVEREAYNSVVRTAGRYHSPGKVVGGEIIALRGIELGVAGSDLGVATRLIAGVDFRRSERVRVINEQTAAADKEIDRVSTAIGPLLADPKRVAALPADKKKVVLALVGHLRAMKEKREALSAQMQQVAAGDAAAIRRINIRDRIHQGVTVEVGSNRLLMKSQSTGPLSLVEDLIGGTVRIESYSELDAALPQTGAADAGVPGAGPTAPGGQGQPG